MCDKPEQTPANWIEALAESDADIAAGRIVPGEVIMQELRESIARMDPKLPHQPRRRTIREC